MPRLDVHCRSLYVPKPWRTTKVRPSCDRTCSAHRWRFIEGGRSRWNVGRPDILRAAPIGWKRWPGFIPDALSVRPSTASGAQAAAPARVTWHWPRSSNAVEFRCAGRDASSDQSSPAPVGQLCCQGMDAGPPRWHGLGSLIHKPRRGLACCRCRVQQRGRGPAQEAEMERTGWTMRQT